MVESSNNIPASERPRTRPSRSHFAAHVFWHPEPEWGAREASERCLFFF